MKVLYNLITMMLIINDIQEDLPVGTLSELASCKHIPRQATAIAVNGRLVKMANWDDTELHPMDSITVISAAFGG